MIHNVEIYVNGELAEQYEDGLGVRLTTILNDPEKLTFTQSEYSFTFDLPCSEKNSRLLEYANVPSKKQKFNKRYQTTIYADNMLIFEGTLKVDRVEENTFKCNVFAPKVNNVSEIFGDTKMNEFTWYTPFSGMSTINHYNATPTVKFFFPLVSYGLFQKVPEQTLGSGHKVYSDKYTIDDTNRFYYNSFVPSLNMVELLKKICQSKKYQLSGDILTDKLLNEIYLSNYIAEDQDPEYNYGGIMGACSLRASFKNYDSSNNHPDVYTSYALQYPPTKPYYNNYDTVTAYNLLDERINKEHNFLTVTPVSNESKMIVDGGIQIPADGWYQISCQVTARTYNESLQNISVKKNISGDTESQTIPYSRENMPIEFQLLKYDADDGVENNISHDIIYFGEYPNESSASTANRETGSVGRGEWSPAAATSPAYTNMPSSGDRFSSTSCVTAVDPYNNPNFIMGFQSSMYGVGNAYIKDGYSWSPDCGDVNRAVYNCSGYYKKASPSYIQTDVNKNTMANGGYNNVSTTTSSVYDEWRSNPQCIVYLHKNDMLIPYCQLREYEKHTTTENTPYRDKYAIYRADMDISLTIKAVAKDITPRSEIKYNMSSKFDDRLNLANFCNKTQKMSDFINDVAKAFNLTVTTTDKEIIMNRRRIYNKPSNPVDLDIKTSEEDIALSSIQYPSSIEVKFQIDQDEETIYRSAERNATDSQLQSNSWLDYADKGYEKINITPVDDATAIEEQLNFAYTGYETFTLPDNTTLDIPVIAKTEWFIEGLDYEKYAQKDGRSLRQRFWTRTNPTTKTLPVVDSEAYYITVPSPYTTDSINLDYKRNNSLLSEFFQIDIDATADGMEVEAYLTPLEYMKIKNGSSVKIDGTLYRVNKIDGYDPTCQNKTTLHLMNY